MAVDIIIINKKGKLQLLINTIKDEKEKIKLILINNADIRVERERERVNLPVEEQKELFKSSLNGKQQFGDIWTNPSFGNLREPAEPPVKRII